ncbi:MAG: hypothetical protein V9G11_04795 [Bifidobacterium adolescentis]
MAPSSRTKGSHPGRGVREPQPDVGGPSNIPLGCFQPFVTQLLQMGRLGLDEEFVDRLHLQIVDQFQIDPQPDTRKQVHRLFGTDLLGVLEIARARVLLT